MGTLIDERVDQRDIAATVVDLAVRGYLRIEKARFGERLRVDGDVEPASRNVAVPGLILQPLVENAVGHGLAPRSRGGTVRVTTRIEDTLLWLEVADDGVGLGDDVHRLMARGHGLLNVKRRLEAYFAGKASLELLDNPAGEGTLSRIVLPPLSERASREDTVTPAARSAAESP